MIGPYTITATDIHGSMTIASRIFPIQGALSNAENHYTLTVTLHSSLPEARHDVLSPRVLGLTAANAAVDIAGNGLQGNGTSTVQFRQAGHAGDMTTVTQLEVTFVGATGDWWSGTITYSIDVDVAYCAYGTQANPDATFYEVVTDSFIDLVVLLALSGTGNAPLIPYVETALAAIEGTLAVGADCSVLPGAGPTLDFPNLANLSPAALSAWFQNAAWRFFCQCAPAPPGSPDPIEPYPPPIIPPTLIVPVQPAPSCDNADLCSYLEAMKAQLQSIAAQLSYLRTDVRLVERQSVPFTYVLGTLHSGLTGAGQFSVSGILALAVEVTTIPGSSGVETGDPLARFGLGWVTTGTTDGWRRSVPLRHNPMWIDAEFDDTLVGYSLEPLVVANIREISRAP